MRINLLGFCSRFDTSTQAGMPLCFHDKFSNTSDVALCCCVRCLLYLDRYDQHEVDDQSICFVCFMQRMPTHTEVCTITHMCVYPCLRVQPHLHGCKRMYVYSLQMHVHRRVDITLYVCVNARAHVYDH